MIAYTFIGQEETNIERLQRRLVERQRMLDIADGQNDMGQHDYSPSRSGLQRLVSRYLQTHMLRSLVHFRHCWDNLLISRERFSPIKPALTEKGCSALWLPD